MSLTQAQVEKVSLLARLQLTADELATMTTQLGQIVDYMALLNELDTSGVEPMAHAIDVADVFREDQVRPSLEQSVALANAPHQDGQCYLVPAVLGD